MSTKKKGIQAIELNDGQKMVLSLLLEWWNHSDLVFEIAGAAGTGKTTLIRYLIQELNLRSDEVLFMAYTGKASLAIAKTGIPAKTIHSTIFNIGAFPKRDLNGDIVHDSHGKVIYEKGFYKKPHLDPWVKLLIVDEGSMVSDDIARKILSFNVKTIVLGDLHQLPPVNGSSYFLKKPDAVLTEIMRQKNDSIIPYFAQSIIQRTYMYARNLPETQIEFRRVPMDARFQTAKEFLKEEEIKKADIVLVRNNEGRRYWMPIVRRIALNYTPNDSYHPVLHDKIICRKNNYDRFILDDKTNISIPLVNGLIGFVDDIDASTIDKREILIDFKPDFSNQVFRSVPIDQKYFASDDYSNKNTRRSSRFEKRDKNYFELGYAITTHLAQGSEFDNIIIDARDTWGSVRERDLQWLYTSVTRAKKHMIILI